MTFGFGEERTVCDGDIAKILNNLAGSEIKWIQVVKDSVRHSAIVLSFTV